MSEKTTITTAGEVRFSYLNVFTPKAIDGGDEKYGVSVLISKKDKKTIKQVEDAIAAAFEAGKAKLGLKADAKMPKNLKQPLRDGDDERPDDANYEGVMFFNANNKKQPGIVNAKRQQILSEQEVYSGCYGKVNVTFYAFNVGSSKGIACALNHVQKLRDGEALDGRVSIEDAFEDEEFEDDDDLAG